MSSNDVIIITETEPEVFAVYHVDVGLLEELRPEQTRRLKQYFRPEAEGLSLRGAIKAARGLGAEYGLDIWLLEEVGGVG